MALKQSKQVAAGLPALTSSEAYCPVVVTGEYVVATGDAIGDIVEMGALPANCVPVDLIVDNGALGASATLDAGILSGDFARVDGVRTMGNEFVAAAAAATSGVIRRNKNVNAVVSDASDRGWGIKFLGANPAAGQVIRATMVCRNKMLGIA